MSFQNQFTKTTTDANLMETVHHGSAEYPFRYYYENIALILSASTGTGTVSWNLYISKAEMWFLILVRFTLNLMRVTA